MTSPTPGVTADELARLRELAEKAPDQGPWDVFRESHGYPLDAQLYVMPSEIPMGPEMVPENVAEAAYIAAVSPSAVLRLLAHAEALEARVRLGQEAIDLLIEGADDAGPGGSANVDHRWWRQKHRDFLARHAAASSEAGPNGPVSRSEGAPK